MIAGRVRGFESAALIKDTGDRTREVREYENPSHTSPRKICLHFRFNKATHRCWKRAASAVRAKPDWSFIIEIGTKKISELRELAGRLEARATRKALARSMPRLCADLLTAARELRHLCRALEVAGKNSITIKAELDR
jgi:hypothetical protein